MGGEDVVLEFNVLEDAVDVSGVVAIFERFSINEFECIYLLIRMYIQIFYTLLRNVLEYVYVLTILAYWCCLFVSGPSRMCVEIDLKSSLHISVTSLWITFLVFFFCCISSCAMPCACWAFRLDVEFKYSFLAIIYILNWFHVFIQTQFITWK